MKKIIAGIAVLAVLALPSASFAAGQINPNVLNPLHVINAGAAGNGAVNGNTLNAVTAVNNATAVNANANEYLTFGFGSFKIANPSLKILKNVNVGFEKMQGLGTFAGAGFTFKF